MRAHYYRHFSSLALLLAAGASAWSQQVMGTFNGEVRNPAGAPIAGARVIIQSPALFSPRTVVTSSKGDWRVVGLPPGVYRIQAAADGYIGSEARDVRLGLGASLTQILTLKPQATAATVVEVVANSSTEDKSDTKAAVNYSSEKLEAIAFDRGFDGAANLTPGITYGPNGQAAVRGGTTQDTAFRINGTDIQDDIQGQVVGRYYIEDNIEDIQVMLSPLNARFGRNLGGAVNAVTKTGSNIFNGSVRATISNPKRWNATNPFTRTQNSQKEGYNREYQLTASGPLVKDRLWISVGTILTPRGVGDGWWNAPGFDPAICRTGNSGIDAATALGPSAFGFDSAYKTQMFSGVHNFTERTEAKYYDLKLTGAINNNHTVELALMKNTFDIGNRAFYWSDTPILRKEQATTQTDKNSVVTLGYRGILSANIFLDAGFNQKEWSMEPPQGDPTYGNVAQVILFADNRAAAFNPYYGMGNAWTYGTAPKEERNNRRGWANLNIFRESGQGKHELDLGIEYNESTHKQGTSFGTTGRLVLVGGAYQLGDANDFLFPTIRWTGFGSYGQSGNGRVGLAPAMRIYSSQDGTHKNRAYSIYANDNWTINPKWQVMAGLRMDREMVDDIDGSRLASTTTFSPRFQVRFDPTGEDKHLFTLSAARFGGDFTGAFTNAFVQSGRSAYTEYGWSGIGNQPLPGTAGDLVAGREAYGVRFVNFAQLTDPANYTGDNGNTAFQFYDSRRVYALDPSLKPPTMDELSLSYRRSFEGGFLRLTGVHRKWKRNWAFATDWAQDQMVTIPDPSGLLHEKYTPAIRVFNSDDISREYNGLEMEFRQTLSRVWSLIGSYTYSRLTGNTESGQQSGSTWRDNSVPGYYFQRRALLAMGLSDSSFAPSGPLVNDQNNRSRLVIMADLPLGRSRVTASWIVQFDEGTPWSATNSARITGLPSQPPYTSAAPTTYTKYYGRRGEYTYNDSYIVNFKLTFNAPLRTVGLTVFGSLSISNLFNHTVQTRYNSTIWSNNNGADALWLDASAFGKANPTQANYWQDGRSIQVSAGLRF